MTLHDLYGVPYVSEFFNVFHSMLEVAQVFLWVMGGLVLGMLVGRAVYLGLSRLLRLIRFDRLVGRLESGELFAPSMAVARFGYFFVVLWFFLLGLESVATDPVKEVITDVYLRMGEALVFVGLLALTVFIGHYGGALIRFVINLSGYRVGEPFYVAFLSLMLIGLLNRGVRDYVAVSEDIHGVLTILLILIVPPVVAFRGTLSRWSRGDVSWTGSTNSSA